MVNESHEDRLFLVQYEKEDTIVQCMLPEEYLIIEEISPKLEDLDKKKGWRYLDMDEDITPREMKSAMHLRYFVEDEDVKRACTVLYCRRSFAAVRRQFINLRHFSQEEAINQKNMFVKMDPWCLVHYITGDNSLSYTVIRFSQCIVEIKQEWWDDDDSEFCVVEDNGESYRGWILLKSLDREIVVSKLKKLQLWTESLPYDLIGHDTSHYNDEFSKILYGDAAVRHDIKNVELYDPSELSIILGDLEQISKMRFRLEEFKLEEE